MPPPIGLIAGQGLLPILTSRGIRAAGREVACVGLAGEFDPALPATCDHFGTAGLARLGRWIRLLERWQVREAVMVGRVRKAGMYQPGALWRRMPDFRAARLWLGTLRGDRRNDRLLGAVADELESAGITLIDSTRYIPDHLADPGPMTRRRPGAGTRGDIAFGWPIVMRLGEMDIGQAIAVKDGEVIAVEAIEGTDEMIRRAGELCPKGGWTLLKTAKPAQDLRFDVPTVGRRTIENLAAARAGCLAVEAGRVILLEKPELIEAAHRAGLAVVGVSEPGADPAHAPDPAPPPPPPA